MRGLSKYSISAALLFLSALPASAQSRDYWSGFYGGMSIGAAWDNMSWDWNLQGGAAAGIGAFDQYPGGFNSTSFIGGGHIGYQQKFGMFVPGLEFSYLVHHAKGTSSVTDGQPVTHLLTAKAGDIMTLAGRLGLAQDRWLGYVRAGAAWSEFKFDSQGAGVNETASNGWAPGYVLGFGGEYALTSNLSIGSEYNYMQFAVKRSGVENPVTTFPSQHSAQPVIQTWTVRLNYRLN